MRAIEAKHVIVGGGLLGLSTADHLLRRGADGVVVVEKGSVPGQVRRGAPGLVLSTGIPENQRLEDRSHLLLDDWPTYLEIDPQFRRAGSVVVPAPERLPTDWESLDGDDLRVRSLNSEAVLAFAGRDGLVSAEELSGTLHWHVRRQGGRFVTDCAVQTLEHRGDRVAFTGTSRFGSGARVYLTAGAQTPALARTLGLVLPFRHLLWQEMQLVGEPGEFAIVRLRRDLPEDLCDAGLLEMESVSEAVDPPALDTEVIVVREDGTIHLSLIRPCGPRTEHVAVDWGLWEEVRDELAAIVPALERVRVRSGRAENIVALNSDPAAPVVECDGHLIVGVGFGLSGLLLSLSMGEALAEAGLATL